MSSPNYADINGVLPSSFAIGKGTSSLTFSNSALTSAYTLTFPPTAGTSGQVLTTNGSGTLSWTTPATGTVTSVGFSDASTTPIYTIGSSPVTTSGTITQTLNTQTANYVFAGPSSGAAAQPAFRALVSGDIPNNAANTTGNAATATNIAGGTANYVVYQSASGTTGFISPSTSGYVLTSNGTGSAPTFQAAGGGGGSLTATYVGYGNSSGSLSGSSDFTWSGANDTSPTYTMTLGNGSNNFTIQGYPTQTLSPPNFYITGAQAYNSGNRSGGQVIIGGGASNGNGGGGGVTLQGYNAVGSGGGITIQAGNSTGTYTYGYGGVININGGNITNSSSVGYCQGVSIGGGNSNASAASAGQVVINGGNNTASGGSGGPLYLNGGNGSNSSYYGSALTLNNGTGSAHGTIQISTANVVRFTVGTSGQLGIGTTPTYGSAGAVLLSGGSSAAPTWGNPQVSNTADSSAITNAETYIQSMSLAANSLAAGNTFKITVVLSCSTTTSSYNGSDAVNVRLGTAGTTSDTVMTYSSPTGTGTSNGDVWFDFLLTFRSIGSSGSVQASCAPTVSASIWGTQAPTSTTNNSINTTSALKLGVSVKSSNTYDSFTVKQCTIAQVN